jgi:hypothetical protein
MLVAVPFIVEDFGWETWAFRFYGRQGSVPEARLMLVAVRLEISAWFTAIEEWETWAFRFYGRQGSVPEARLMLVAVAWETLTLTFPISDRVGFDQYRLQVFCRRSYLKFK